MTLASGSTELAATSRWHALDIPTPTSKISASMPSRRPRRLSKACCWPTVLTFLTSTTSGSCRPTTTSRARDLLEIASVAAEPAKPDATWLTAGGLPAARTALEALRPIVTDIRAALSRVNELFDERVLALDAGSLRLRFVEVHRGLGKLRPAYWRDKHTLRSCTKSGRVRRQDIDGLSRVVACKRRQQDLVAAEEYHARSLGAHYYKSPQSDFDLIERALAGADKIVRFASGWVPYESLRCRLTAQSEPSPEVVQASAELRQRLNNVETCRQALGQEFAELAASAASTDVSAMCEEVGPAVASLAKLWRKSDAVSSTAPASLDELETWLRDRLEIDDTEAALQKDERFDRELLGPRYSGSQTDLDQLGTDLDWADRLRNLLGRPASAGLADRLLLLDAIQFQPIALLLGRAVPRSWRLSARGDYAGPPPRRDRFVSYGGGLWW